MKALTLWPEWAWAICCLFKRVENRGWEPPLAAIGYPFLVHAGSHIGGQKMHPDRQHVAMERVCRVAQENGWHWSRIGNCDFELQAAIPLRHPEFDVLVSPTVRFCADLIPRGTFVAQARLEKLSVPVPPAARERFHISTHVPPWGELGARHWHLSEVRLLAPAPPHAGAQRLWTVPDPVVRGLEVLEDPDACVARWQELTHGHL